MDKDGGERMAASANDDSSGGCDSLHGVHNVCVVRRKERRRGVGELYSVNRPYPNVVLMFPKAGQTPNTVLPRSTDIVNRSSAIYGCLQIFQFHHEIKTNAFHYFRKISTNWTDNSSFYTALLCKIAI